LDDIDDKKASPSQGKGRKQPELDSVSGDPWDDPDDDKPRPPRLSLTGKLERLERLRKLAPGGQARITVRRVKGDSMDLFPTYRVIKVIALIEPRSKR
jgi:hypothetical protein